jgi:hypothetical protein
MANEVQIALGLAELHWRELLQCEHTAWDALERLEASEEFQGLSRSKQSDKRRVVALLWWRAAASALDAYRRLLHDHAVAPRHGPRRPAPSPPSFDLINRLANVAEKLADGTIPDVVRTVSHRGRAASTPSEKHAIRWAVAYWQACQPDGLGGRDGIVVSHADPTPVKTLQGWFGAKRNTIQGWTKRYPPLDFGPETPRKYSIDHTVAIDPPSEEAADALMIAKYRELTGGGNATGQSEAATANASVDPLSADAISGSSPEARALIFYTKKAADIFRNVGRTKEVYEVRGKKPEKAITKRRVRRPSK